MPADIIVFAGAIVCRQLSWKWREFFDRSFFNTHTPSLVGKQFAFLVSGPLSLLPELRETYEALDRAPAVEPRHSSPTRPRTAALLDAALDQLAERLVRFCRSGYIRPQTFLGVAGMKIFRDDIWAELKRGLPGGPQGVQAPGLLRFPAAQDRPADADGPCLFRDGASRHQEPVPFDDQGADGRPHAPGRAERRGLRRSADERHATHPRVVFPRQDG